MSYDKDQVATDLTALIADRSNNVGRAIADAISIKVEDELERVGSMKNLTTLKDTAEKHGINLRNFRSYISKLRLGRNDDPRLLMLHSILDVLDLEIKIVPREVPTEFTQEEIDKAVNADEDSADEAVLIRESTNE
jgi:transcriptional regulator with XRE-family HTH domain